MLFTVDSKADAKGKDIYVPHYLRLNVKDRIKVSNYVGFADDDVNASGWWLLPFPVGIIVTLACIQLDYVIVGAILFALTILYAFGMFGYTIWDDMRKPPQPEVAIVHMDDQRWKTLLVAFGDDHKLWQRLTSELRPGYRPSKCATTLSRKLNDTVSAFMLDIAPSVESAQSIRCTVERIFAEYDCEQEEKRIAHELAKEVRALGEKQIFEAQVQMAQQDIMRQAIMAPLADN